TLNQPNTSLSLNPQFISLHTTGNHHQARFQNSTTFNHRLPHSTASPFHLEIAFPLALHHCYRVHHLFGSPDLLQNSVRRVPFEAEETIKSLDFNHQSHTRSR
ncbi:unnamed protein product, partial [Arabidopsis halleri]